MATQTLLSCQPLLIACQGHGRGFRTNKDSSGKATGETEADEENGEKTIPEFQDADETN